jgi:uncharacterized protein
MVLSDSIKFNIYFEASKWIKGVTLVGFTEEILFRGFFLKKIASFLKFGFANTFTAVLFLLIHFPGWMASNALPTGVFPNSHYLPLSLVLIKAMFLRKPIHYSKTNSL